MKKNIEWLKKETAKEMSKLEHNRNKKDGDLKYQTLRSVAEKIDQLDEPEVLSQEWIDTHSMAVAYDGIPDQTEIVYVDDLENLLVPKQELPMIPKYIADWITQYREVFDLYPALKILEKDSLIREQIYKWYRMNTHEFVNAYLTGKYEVEEEPLYYALVKGHELLDDVAKYWAHNKYDSEDLFISYETRDDSPIVVKNTKNHWVDLGINDSNADFIKVV